MNLAQEVCVSVPSLLRQLIGQTMVINIKMVLYFFFVGCFTAWLIKCLEVAINFDQLGVGYNGIIREMCFRNNSHDVVLKVRYVKDQM